VWPSYQTLNRYGVVILSYPAVIVVAVSRQSGPLNGCGGFPHHSRGRGAAGILALLSFLSTFVEALSGKLDVALSVGQGK